MNKILFLSVWNCMLFMYAGAQAGAMKPAGGGRFQSEPADYITPDQQLAMLTNIRQHITELQQKGILPDASSASRVAAVSLGWPLRQAAGYNDNGYYSITAFLDHNTNVNQLQDYNCGNRTWEYNGWNHDGTDITLWPFPWTKMNNNAVEVIAAAPGTIVDKIAGNDDQTCDFTSCGACEWNAVIVQQADGTIARYGHLKKNSLTTKAIGATVLQGEFLGLVGSSGHSWLPHLHFDLWTDLSGSQNGTESKRIDPWAGSCNNITSWWAAQQAYRVPTINKVMTHSAVPNPGGKGVCPGGEAVNAKAIFSAGETIYTGAYYRDNVSGGAAIHTIYKPDNSVWQTWTQHFTTTDDYSWQSYSFTLPSSNTDNGTWKYEVKYNGQIVYTSFTLGTGAAPSAPDAALPLQLLSFTADRAQQQIVLQWETEKEANINRFELQRSIDGVNFEPINTTQAKNLSAKQLYNYTDKSPLRGFNYYRLKIIDQNGSAQYSAIAKIDNRQGILWMEVSPNPFHNQVAIKTGGELNKLELLVTTITGQTVLSKTVTGIRGQTIYVPTGGLLPGVYILSIYEGNQRVHYRKIIKGQ